MKYITYSDEIPIEKKMLVCTSPKIPQSILEQIVRDVRKNKPKEETPATVGRQRVEA